MTPLPPRPEGLPDESRFDPRKAENWQYHDEYEFWYIPYPEILDKSKPYLHDIARERGFFPWENIAPPPAEATRTVGEPVAWRYRLIGQKEWTLAKMNPHVTRVSSWIKQREIEPLYTTPAARQTDAGEQNSAGAYGFGSPSVEGQPQGLPEHQPDTTPSTGAVEALNAIYDLRDKQYFNGLEKSVHWKNVLENHMGVICAALQSLARPTLQEDAVQRAVEEIEGLDAAIHFFDHVKELIPPHDVLLKAAKAYAALRAPGREDT